MKLKEGCQVVVLEDLLNDLGHNQAEFSFLLLMANGGFRKACIVESWYLMVGRGLASQLFILQLGKMITVGVKELFQVYIDKQEYI